jgi:hypothetical protein
MASFHRSEGHYGRADHHIELDVRGRVSDPCIAHCALVIAFIFARQAKFEPALD